MKIMVTGARGQLGSDLCELLPRRGHTCIGVDIDDFDLTDGEAVLAAVRAADPDAVIHCAAYTAVDRAETEPEVCCNVNANGTLNMVRAAQAVGARFCYISTDYIFPGTGEEPWKVDDKPGPRNVYGLSKLQGEEAVRGLTSRFFIVRTSWVYGLHGRNFVRTMLRLGAERQQVSVVDDQVGTPTYSRDLAAMLADLIVTKNYGIYHATNEGFCSWYEFADRIMALGCRACKVVPVHTAQYHTLAVRPLNSRLSKACLDEAGIARLPHWEDALNRYMMELSEAGEL